jgi:hypothetical protein
MSSTRSAARVFDFAVRPHDNAADAVAYFDTLTRLMVRRGLTPAEWAEYGAARAAYVRASLGMARNMPGAPTPKVRPRSRRPRAVAHDRNDRPSGPRVTLDELAVLLEALRLASPTFRRMAAFACGTTDDADGWLALASGDAAELTDQAFWRFAYDAEGKAA